MDNYAENYVLVQINSLQRKVANLEGVGAKHSGRLTAIEDINMRLIDAAARNTVLKSQTARLSSVVDPPPVSRRADATAILEMGAFIRRLLDPDDLGFAVTQEVRQLARKALDLPKALE